MSAIVFSRGRAPDHRPDRQIPDRETARLHSSFPMTFLPKKTPSRMPVGASTRGTHVVPVRDVQWDRPIFRPPELPVYPRLFNSVPFTAMRALRPTRPEAVEPNL